MINYFPARNPDFCRICPNCVSLLTNITECGVRVDFAEVEMRENCKLLPTTPPHRIASAFGDPGKILLLPPPPQPPNRVGFWRSGKRLKKFNNHNLAALDYSAQRKQATKCQIKGDYARQSFTGRCNIKLSIITLHRRINITYAQTLHDDYTVGMCRK